MGRRVGDGAGPAFEEVDVSDPMKAAWDEVAESFSALGQAMKDRYTGGTSGTEASTAAAETGADSSEATGEATGDAAGGDAAGSQRSGDATAALREAFDQLLAAGRQFGDRAAALVRDDEVKAQAKHVATALNSALEATVDQIGDEVRGFFKGRRGGDDAAGGGGTIEAEEHTDATAPGEVTPPPLSPEGDAIP
jgi:hypothetical protein